MSDKIFWALLFGIIGGFAFAAGTALYDKTQSKIKLGGSTGGAVGSPADR